MKRVFVLLLLAGMLLLSGCGSFLNREYSEVSPHSAGYYESADKTVLRAEDSQDLVNDVLLLVGDYAKTGTVWLYNCNTAADAGDIVAQACQEVQRETPMGSYALDYLTYEVGDGTHNYYEVRLSLRYRRTQEQINAIVNATSSNAIYDLLTTAASHSAGELTLRISYFDRQENTVRQTVETVQRETGRSGETPWEVNFYPPTGNVVIVEIIMGSAQIKG
jgi:uncharacterized protein YceK